MMKRFALAGLLLLSCAAGPTTAPQLTPKSSIDDVLDAMDERGKSLKSLTADVAMADSDPNLGDVGRIDQGKLYYQDLGNGDARFRVLFDKRIIGASSHPAKHDYLYTNGTLTDRDYIKKTEDTRQVLKPGEKMEIFKLDGPFPLPLGQDKAEVHKRFEVKLDTAEKDDPANTVHLTLTPNDGTKLARQFKTIDLWLDMTSDFPARVTTVTRNGSEQKQTDLTHVEVNPTLNDSDFKQEQITPNEWNRKGE